MTLAEQDLSLIHRLTGDCYTSRILGREVDGAGVETIWIDSAFGIGEAGQQVGFQWRIDGAISGVVTIEPIT